MRRGRIDIIIAILEIARKGVIKTNIVYRANLNFKLAGKYLDILQKNGLMENRSDKYITTEKGEKFLEKARELIFSFPS